MDSLDVTLRAALSCLNVPYVWGGNHPLEGFDCSGFCLWVLKSAGVGPKNDCTAQDIYNYFEVQGISRRAHGPGALAFYGESLTKISHIAFCLNAYQVIEAGGGSPHCNTKEKAKEIGAMVRVVHLQSRKDLLAILTPDYSRIGRAF